MTDDLLSDKWWRFHPIIAPLPQGFLDGNTSHKDAREWMKRATAHIEELEKRLSILNERIKELEGSEEVGFWHGVKR